MGLILSHKHFKTGLSLWLVAEEKLRESHSTRRTRTAAAGLEDGGAPCTGWRAAPLSSEESLADTSRDAGTSARPNHQMIHRHVLVIFVLIILRFSYFYTKDNLFSKKKKESSV